MIQLVEYLYAAVSSVTVAGKCFLGTYTGHAFAIHYKYMSLFLPRDAKHDVACFRLNVHTHVWKQ